MPANSFIQRIKNPSQFNLLVEFTCPAGQPPKKIQSFLSAYAAKKPSWKDIEISGITVTHSPSGVVTASPTDVIAHIQMTGGLQGLEYIPHVSAKGMNRAEIETFLRGLISYGMDNAFIITGDNPAEGTPVFELDSLALLQMIRQMNADACVEAGPGKKAKTLTTGAAVGLAKYEEGTCLQQLIKLEKKVLAGGAEFVITNLIFDVRKVEDFFRYLKERELEVPVFGNVFFLHEPAARRMLGEKLPGVYVSEELYERVRGESYEDQVERAALQVAMWKDLGAAGVDLGNIEEYDLLCKIIDRAIEIGSDWRKSTDRIHFPPPIKEPYYIYTPQGERTPLRDPAVPKKRLLLNWVHNLFFEPGSRGYNAIRTLFEHSKSIKNGDGLLYDATMVIEYIGKRSIAQCRSCGDCYLPENFFVCLMGECAKGLPNVPCGDSTIDGRCGVDTNKLCAGQLVYDASRYFTKEMEALYQLVNQPKNPKLKQTSSFRSFFLGLDHRGKAPLIQIAELLHATLPKVKQAFDIIKSTPDGFHQDNPGLDYLQKVIELQAFYNPDYIDANVDDVGEGDPVKAAKIMREVIRLICEQGGGIPPCIDSSDVAVIQAGLEEYYRLRGTNAAPPLINSANKERRDFVWDLQKIGKFSIVYMLMAGAASGEGIEEAATPEEHEQNALEFFREAKAHQFQPGQIFFDTTVIPLAIEFSRYNQPGFNYVSIEGIRRIMHNAEMKGVNTILGVTNLTRDFPPARKMGLLRAYIKIAMDAGLTAAIVDVRKKFGIQPPEDQEIVDIVAAFTGQDGTPEAFDRMQQAYMKYKSYGLKKAKV